MNTITGVTVVIEDNGQDFLEFDIQEGRIVETRPLQGWVWNGKRVIDEHISVGDFISIWTSEGSRNLLYPVIEVRPLTGSVQIGPTDI